MAAVRCYKTLTSPPDRPSDRLAALAARLLDTPAASVTDQDQDQIWFKAVHGLDGVSQVGRDPVLCSSAICSNEFLVIPGTLADPVAASHPLVTGPPGLRFYAAAPIATPVAVRAAPNGALLTDPAVGSRFIPRCAAGSR